MTWGLGILLAGLLLVYAGVTGRSLRRLVLGDNTTPSTIVNGPIVQGS